MNGLQTLSVGASGLPYTIWYGNLHSQTNHSDGGGDLATCPVSRRRKAAPMVRLTRTSTP